MFASTTLGPDKRVAVRVSKQKRDGRIERRRVTGGISRRLGCNLVMVRRHMAIEDSEKLKLEGQRRMRQIVRFRKSNNAAQHERFRGMREQRRSQRELAKG